MVMREGDSVCVPRLKGTRVSRGAPSLLFSEQDEAADAKHFCQIISQSYRRGRLFIKVPGCKQHLKSEC